MNRTRFSTTRSKRLLPVVFIAALAAVQGWFGDGDAGAASSACGPFTGDPSQPMIELLTPPARPGVTR